MAEVGVEVEVVGGPVEGRIVSFQPWNAENDGY